MKEIIKFILLLTGAILLPACLDEPDCISRTTNFVNVKFYDGATNQPDTLSINSLTVVGSDSVLVTDREIIQVRLPLRPDQAQTTFIIDSQLGEDTLVLTYQLSARLISEECGVETIYSNLDYGQHDFDSINVVNNILIEDVTEDIRLYF